jgi:hypothetical protein
MVFLLMRTFFSLFSLFCVSFFVHLPFIFSFFHKSVAKTRYNLRVIKKLLSVFYRFSTLTSTNCLTNIVTSKAKTHNMKDVDLFFSFFYI